MFEGSIPLNLNLRNWQVVFAITMNEVHFRL